MSLYRMLRDYLHRIGMLYVQLVCRREYARQVSGAINERPIELAFLFRQLSDCRPGKVLDVGTGMTSLPHLLRTCGFDVTATDNISDYWPRGMVNRHYHVVNDDITRSSLVDAYDVITCISVLEHIREHRLAIRSMYRLLAPGGRLILTCPYNEEQYVQNVYALPESSVTEKFSFETQSFSRKEIDRWLEDVPFELVEQQYWRFFDGGFWTCGDRVVPPQAVGATEVHQLTCLLLRKPS